MPDVRGIVEHIFARKFAAVDSIGFYVEVDVYGAFGERISHLAQGGVSNACAEFRDEIFVVSNRRVEGLFSVQGVVVDCDGYGHDGRERPQHSRNARFAILIDAPDNVPDTRELDAVAHDAAYRADNRRVRHEVVDVACVRERVPEGENFFAVNGGDSARRAE